MCLIGETDYSLPGTAINVGKLEAISRVQLVVFYICTPNSRPTTMECILQHHHEQWKRCVTSLELLSIFSQAVMLV